MTVVTHRWPISIVIPTFRREAVLVDTLRLLLELEDAAAEIVVVDQTPAHEPGTDAYLEAQAAAVRLRHIRLAVPSITAAMNKGLLEARQPTVMFLDDDIRPSAALVRAHCEVHRAHTGVLGAGRVLQPWDRDEDDAHRSGPFHFASLEPRWIAEFMGGNFSVDRELALALGGFDENFVHVAYRFEAEFAHRWRAAGHRILFAPEASLHHLKAGTGGTRSYGDHLTTWRPDHAVGAYYWALRTRAWREFVTRPARSVTTRFHLRHPWRIPPTLISELGGMLWALRLNRAGPRLIAGHVSNR